jgi:predicted nucleic acid-binding protein
MPTGFAAVLVDTNVLVYAYDPADKAKQQRAANVLARVGLDGVGAVSTQILSEFFVNVTRKITPALSTAEAERAVLDYVRSWSVVEQTSALITEAIRGVRRYGFAYWDALIWASARLNEIPVVLSEDFSDGSRIGGVRFLNPFVAGFDLESILPSD